MTRRTMHMTGLEPRTMGGLQGFGFTVTFTEPALANTDGGPSGEGERAHVLPANPIEAPRGVEGGAEGASASPANSNFGTVPVIGWIA